MKTPKLSEIHEMLMLDKANIAADTDFRQKKEETAKNAKKD